MLDAAVRTVPPGFGVPLPFVKLESDSRRPQLIRTVRGVGYKLVDDGSR